MIDINKMIDIDKMIDINITNKYKYIILTMIVIVFFVGLFFSFVYHINYSSDSHCSCKEGFSPNTYDPNTYDANNLNSVKLVNEYSHSVNLPLTDTQSCQNACYNAKCSKTGKQCSTDVDCYEDGCKSLLQRVHDKLINEEMAPKDPQNYIPIGEESTGRLIYNQNPQHSDLTYDIGTKASIIDKDAKVPRPYEGVKIWQPPFDAKAQLIDDALAYEYAAEPEQYRSTPVYPKTLTATGLFYDIGPTAANAYLS